MKKQLCIGWMGLIWVNVLSVQAQLSPSGDPGIDQMRLEVLEEKTSEENFRERVLTLYMWIGALQQQGADTRPFYELDTRYYSLENRVNRASAGNDRDAMEQMCRTIDEGFQQVELIQAELAENGPMFTPFESPEKVEGGDMAAEWPMFQGNKHNTGYTEAPGRAGQPRLCRFARYANHKPLS